MGRRTHYTHMPIARGHFSVSWYGLICPSGRSVLAGGSGSTAAYASHDALRDAGVLLCIPVDRGREYHDLRPALLHHKRDYRSRSHKPGSDGGGPGHMLDSALTETQVKGILGIPENIRVVAMLALGYPGKANASRLRKKLDEVVAYDAWRS